MNGLVLQLGGLRIGLMILAVLAFASVFAARADTAPKAALPPVQAPALTVGSKRDTESVIFGEILRGFALSAGHGAAHQKQLGGTRVVWNALLAGDIDAYVDYTGTLSLAILGDKSPASLASIRARLRADYGLVVSAPIGFENSYAIGLSRAAADAGHIQTISDLKQHPALRFGFSLPFMSRDDGWPGLKATYELAQSPNAVDHDLAYRGIETGQLDAVDVYTTDAEISLYDMQVLEDDLGYFPEYAAVIVYREDLVRKAPAFVAALQKMEGAISTPAMRAMNKAVKLEGARAEDIATDFVSRVTGQTVTIEKESRFDLIWRAVVEHMILVGISLLAAIVVALPLGVVAYKYETFGGLLLSVVGILQTIPSLALFVFIIPFTGLGALPAIVALFLYSLLPIVRNTHAGLSGLAPDILESALALGLSGRDRLKLVELPLALPFMLAGIKTAAVINVGTATLGALIGAGGLGEPILIGIRLADMGLIAAGAVPAALLALAIQGLFVLAEKYIVPAGLRSNWQPARKHGLSR